MAMEIEWEEVMKMLKTNPTLKPESILTMLEAQQSQRKSRWDTLGNRQTRMNKSMEYLKPFKIDAEASTIPNLSLCNSSVQLAAELKYYTDKMKEQDLLPAKVARAKDVAMSITQKMIQKKMTQTNPIPLLQTPQPLFSINPTGNINFTNNMGMLGGPGPQIPRSVGSVVVPKVDFLPLPTPTFFPANQKQNGQPKPIPGFQVRQSVFNRGPAENSNLMNNMGMPGGTFGLPISIPHRPNAAPNMAFPQWPPPHLLFPTNQMQNTQQMPMAKMAGHALKEPSEPSGEDVEFFKKVMGLLSALPQDNTATDNSQLSSRKSLLDQKPSSEKFPVNQPLTTAPMADRHSSLNQQLTTKMASQNSTSVHRLNQNSNQVASESNNVMSKDQAQTKKQQLLLMLTLLRSRQESGNLQTNMDSSLPNNQNLQKQGYGPSDRNHNADPDQIGDMHMDPLRRDRSYPSRIYNKELDQSSYGNASTKVGKPKYDNYEADQAPYTRIRLSPSSGNERFQDYDSHRGIINRSQERNVDHGVRRSRPFNDPEWTQRESGARHEKRARLDRDFDPPRSRERFRKHPEDSLANLPADVLKRIQGKDSFTVSAILSEYSERISSK